MSALRYLVVDLLALALIAFAALGGAAWAAWLVAGYAALMVVLKGIALASRMPMKRPADAPPLWVHHLLYAVGLALLLFGRLFVAAGLWALLWALDAYGARRA